MQRTPNPLKRQRDKGDLMANCCGGKNAGKPITWGRYLSGLGVFIGYHGTMRVLLSGASVAIPSLRKVRDFHRSVFESELKEVLQLEDINVNGRLGETREEVCAVDFADDVRTVEIEDGEITMAVPKLHAVPR